MCHSLKTMNTNSSPIRSAVAYARFSSDNQRAESIDAQLADIRAYAAREHYIIIQEYTDEAKTATTDRRPAFQRMIADAGSGSFDTVLVFKLDRFSRDRYDFAFYRRQLKRCGVKIVSINENLSDDPESAILEAVLEGMAEYYSRNLSREVMRKGMLPNAQKCIFNGGTPPLGYDVVNRHYAVNEDEASTVRMIFRMYTDGESYDRIIDRAAAEGRKSKNGKPLSKSTIYDILHNERYRGVYVYNLQAAKDADGRRSRRKKKDDSEIVRIEDGVPRIVSDELFYMAQKRMTANIRQGNRAKRRYLLTGKIFCGKCGSAMVGRSTAVRGVSYNYYDCGARGRSHTCDQISVRAETIEQIVIDAIYTDIICPEARELFADRVTGYIQSVRSETPKLIEEYEKKHEEVMKNIYGIISAVEKGMYSPTMNERIAELEEQKTMLEERIKEAEYKQAVSRANRDEVLEFLNTFGDIRTADLSEQKKAIEIFVDKIIITDSDADIHILSPNNKYKLLHDGGTGLPAPASREIIVIIHRSLRKANKG